ncbi:NHL repeat-containing protein [Edaphobacter modestus]|uniref:NHL repeat-containing protein n=1 Tax=Edaphobacter modestus TaxID=388466 RepID=UPI00102CDD2A|nr:NHL repeat-containing protein [Edaphobacter modestus]
MGNVYSGQHRPVSGATVTLYGVGSSGYGQGAISLLTGTKPIVTDSQGEFNLGGAYQCPSADTLVYLVATGGDAGAGSNGGVSLMSVLGLCGTVGSSPMVVNEMTTVASVYGLAQFIAPGTTTIGSSSSNRTGLTNAFRTVNNLYDGATGQLRAKTPAGNGTVPTTKVNSLANVLAGCVSSPSGSAACVKLFQATTAGGLTPRDTLMAIHNLALHPALNLGSLLLNGPYQPALAGLPNDWTVSIEYTGGGLNYGQLIAVDGLGNLWVPNAVNPGTLSEFGPAGEPLSGSSGFKGGGLNYPLAVAVDGDGNVWAANEGNNTVSRHSASGVPLSGPGYTASSLKLPYALAIDGSGNVLTANGNNSVTKLSSSGALVGQFEQGGLDFPYAIAVDGAANAWVANYGYSNDVSRFSSTGVAATANGYQGGGITGAVGIAIDAGGDAWVASFDRPLVSKLGPNGSPLSGSGYAIPSGAASIAVDGDDTVWTANSDGSVSRFSNAGEAMSPATGYVSNGATAEVGIAIDQSGNVWTSDNYVDSIFEYIGAAAPTTAPLQVAVKNNRLGRRP